MAKGNPEWMQFYIRQLKENKFFEMLILRVGGGGVILLLQQF